MDKFTLARTLKQSRPVVKTEFISELCRGKTVLDLGCVRHTAEYATKDPQWLHARIKATAAKVVGVDYLPEEVAKLRALGYDAVYGDVTRPLEVPGPFDVIVAGDLIEHLSSFDGFFDNCTRLLGPKGRVVITTPNPFFAGQFHFVALKGEFFVSPEHTCWIDPQAMSQLAGRFGYAVEDARFLDIWRLPNLIWESRAFQFDVFTEKWVKAREETLGEKWRRRLTQRAFPWLYPPYLFLSRARNKLVRYSDYLVVLKRTEEG